VQRGRLLEDTRRDARVAPQWCEQVVFDLVRVRVRARVRARVRVRVRARVRVRVRVRVSRSYSTACTKSS